MLLYMRNASSISFEAKHERIAAMDGRNGFALIELLVVVSIIALLMSMLMQALSRVKEQARNSMDLSNRHQFGLFWIMYTDEHDMKFPVRGRGLVISGEMRR